MKRYYFAFIITLSSCHGNTIVLDSKNSALCSTNGVAITNLIIEDTTNLYYKIFYKDSGRLDQCIYLSNISDVYYVIKTDPRTMRAETLSIKQFPLISNHTYKATNMSNGDAAMGELWFRTKESTKQLEEIHDAKLRQY